MLTVEFEDFPLFVRIPGKKPRFVKINSNKLYSNTLPFRWRAQIKSELSLFVRSKLKKRKTPFKTKELRFALFAPESLGCITLARMGDSPEKIDALKYRRWDLTNFAFLWQKIIEDELVAQNWLEDDDVRNVKKIAWEYFPSPFQNRKITVTLM
jgi:hypothetical protein